MVGKVRLNPYQRHSHDDPVINYIQDWLNQLDRRLGQGPFLVQGYAVANLPDATEWGSSDDFTSLIYIYDETGGATLAFSDGTNWRRVQDRAIVS
jgi:hypothetical protein